MDLSLIVLLAAGVTMCMYNSNPGDSSQACLVGLVIGVGLYVLFNDSPSDSSPNNDHEHFSYLNHQEDQKLDSLCPRRSFAYSSYPAPFMEDTVEAQLCPQGNGMGNSEYMTNSAQLCLGPVSKRILATRGGNA